MRAILLSSVMLTCALACSSKSPAAPDAAIDAGVIEDGGNVMDGGEDGSVIDAGRPYEPPPVEIDRRGVIPTSGRQLLLLKALNPGQNNAPADIFGLDLESQELHVLDSDSWVRQLSTSPDGRSLVYSDDFAFSEAQERDLVMVRMLDDGFVPARRVTEVIERAGLYSWATWLGDGRFAALVRHSIAGGRDLDVIDVHAGELYASIDDGDTASGELYVNAVPNALSFVYSSSDGDASRVGFARITADGLETNESHSDLFVVPTIFSHDGTRVILQSINVEGLRRHFYRDLPAGKVTPVEPLRHSDWAFNRIHVFSDDRDRVFATFEDIPVRMSLVTGESIPLTEPGYELDRFIGSRDKRLLFAVVRKDFGDTWLVDPTVLDATGVSPATLLDGSQSVESMGAAGAHHIFYHTDHAGLVVVGRDDAGALQSTKIGDAEPYCLGGGSFSDVHVTEPEDRFTFVSGDERPSIGMIDLSGTRVVEEASIALQHGTSVTCPAWNTEGTAFAYVELTVTATDVDSNGDGFDDYDSESWIYVVHWPKGGSPSEPELVFNSEGWFEVLLAQP